jgi:hypothetical protein
MAAAPHQIIDRPRATPQASLLGRIGWSPDSELNLPQWQTIGRSLGRLGRYSQWWIGDWLLYANRRWGEMYTEAGKITGYDYGSLRNMAYVAQRFEMSRRRDKLSWTHHADLASLGPTEQDYWLDRAVDLRLSTQDLRTELRSAERRLRSNVDSTLHAGQSADVTIMCPKCGESINVPKPGGRHLSKRKGPSSLESK